MTSASKLQCGVTPAQLRTAINSQWQLSAETIQFLGGYFLRKWQSRNLLALIKDGCLHYEGHKYAVCWVGGKVAATSSEHCFLSFRRPLARSIHPTVLVNKENHQ